MSDIYARLDSCGFDQAFVREAILPEWWDDSLAEVPANRALAEDTIARRLGLSLSDLGRSPLQLPSLQHVKFKRNKNKVDPAVTPALLVAQQAAKIVVESIPLLPPFVLEGCEPAEVRKRILRRHRYVDLASLTEFCWDAGIVVLHLAKVPLGSKLFDGLAMFCGDRPVLVLGSRKDGPAWLVFHLAHELGHILKRHVTAGSPPLADSDLMSISDDQQENEADRAACQILTGNSEPRLADLKLTAPRLAVKAAQVGPEHGMDPGVYTLIYGRSNDRWGVATNALKHLSMDSGAREIIAAALLKRLSPEDISESAERFLSVLSPESSR